MLNELLKDLGAIVIYSTRCTSQTPLNSLKLWPRQVCVNGHSIALSKKHSKCGAPQQTRKCYQNKVIVIRRLISLVCSWGGDKKVCKRYA